MTGTNGNGNGNGATIGTSRVKQGLAQMLKGGVIVSAALVDVNQDDSCFACAWSERCFLHCCCLLAIFAASLDDKRILLIRRGVLLDKQGDERDQG